MNGRIKELAIQSGLIASHASDHEGLRDFDYRQFAELIVRECAHLIEVRDCRVEPAPHIYLLKHFGL